MSPALFFELYRSVEVLTSCRGIGVIDCDLSSCLYLNPRFNLHRSTHTSQTSRCSTLLSTNGAKWLSSCVRACLCLSECVFVCGSNRGLLCTESIVCKIRFLSRKEKFYSVLLGYVCYTKHFVLHPRSAWKFLENNQHPNQSCFFFSVKSSSVCHCHENFTRSLMSLYFMWIFSPPI